MALTNQFLNGFWCGGNTSFPEPNFQWYSYAHGMSPNASFSKKSILVS
jgi:hypothetical protein